jgi:hypothetical protein
VQLLSQYAPTWLVQMPALLSAADFEALQRKTAGATRERMLRELAEALEVVTRERPLVLVLEDLQWSDPSTLEWLAFMARRAEGARLLVIGRTGRWTSSLAGIPSEPSNRNYRAIGTVRNCRCGC